MDDQKELTNEEKEELAEIKEELGTDGVAHFYHDLAARDRFSEKELEGANIGWGVAGDDTYTSISSKIYKAGVIFTTEHDSEGCLESQDEDKI